MAALTPDKRRAGQIVRALHRAYPGVGCALQHDGPLQLLIATILSAQCTDQRVNMVTPQLFRHYPAAADLAAVPQTQLEREIQSTGFFRSKAKSIKACCQQLVDRHGGQVPAELEELVELPGVGRKTANVVLGTAFGKAAGVVVDTHVTRIAQRLGLTRQKTPEKIEQDLMAVLPKKAWIDFSHLIIHHGRQVCKARRPLCDVCPLATLCPRIGVET